MKPRGTEPLAEITAAIATHAALLDKRVTSADLAGLGAAMPSIPSPTSSAPGWLVEGGDPDAMGNPTPPEPKLPKMPAERYFRHNGEEYLPRALMVGANKSNDVAFIRDAYGERQPVLLYGEPGTGKTFLIEAAFPNLVTVQGTVETETSDFIGSWTQQPDGTYRWVDGPLVVAAEKGLPLLVDEIALIDSRVMAVVYGLMDGRDTLVVTANPERGEVHAAAGFLVYGACNPNVPGANMSDALLSRFPIKIEMTTDWSIAAKLGASKAVIQCARNLNLKVKSGEMTTAPQLRELITFTRLESRFGTGFAVRNLFNCIRPEDREVAAPVFESVFGEKPQGLVL